MKIYLTNNNNQIFGEPKMAKQNFLQNSDLSEKKPKFTKNTQTLQCQYKNK